MCGITSMVSNEASLIRHVSHHLKQGFSLWKAYWSNATCCTPLKWGKFLQEKAVVIFKSPAKAAKRKEWKIKDNIELQFIPEHGWNVHFTVLNHHLVGPQPAQQPGSLVCSSGIVCSSVFSLGVSETIGTSSYSPTWSDRRSPHGLNFEFLVSH